MLLLGETGLQGTLLLLLLVLLENLSMHSQWNVYHKIGNIFNLTNTSVHSEGWKHYELSTSTAQLSKLNRERESAHESCRNTTNVESSLCALSQTKALSERAFCGSAAVDDVIMHMPNGCLKFSRCSLAMKVNEEELHSGTEDQYNGI